MMLDAISMKSVEPDCGNPVRGMMAIFGGENAIKCKNNGTTGGVMLLHAFTCRNSWIWYRWGG